MKSAASVRRSGLVQRFRQATKTVANLSGRSLDVTNKNGAGTLFERAKRASDEASQLLKS